MKNIGRRDFIRKIPGITAGMVIGSQLTDLTASISKINMDQNDISAVIPLPVQVVIDDVGWWSGKDGSKQQEPYRTGISRDHKPADYDAIASLGRSLGIRPQAAMILCEWDKKNILRKLPHSTWMGRSWDNSKWTGPWQEEAADIIRNNSQNFEITLHGIGHEFWDGNTFTRAEWADKNGTMRPRQEVEKHLEYYGRILDQHNLGPFPSSFVPTAFLHGFGVTTGNKISMAEILKRHGVTYINTPFSTMHNAKAASHVIFGFDSGVLTVDRGRDLMNWDATGKFPKGKVKGPTCGMHWANLVHTDPSRNQEIVDEWVKILSEHKENFETMLAPDSAFFRKQLVHHYCTKAELAGNKIKFDFTSADALPSADLKSFALKIKSSSMLSFNPVNIKISGQSVINKNEYFLYTLSMERINTDSSAELNFSVNG